jgi:hypothetical protein
MRFSASLWIAAGLFIGAYFGARIAQQLPPLVLRRIFSVILVAIALRLWINR